jgi:hypothetical protein
MNRLKQLNAQFSKNASSSKTIDIDGRKYPELVDHDPSEKTKMDYFNK